MEGFWRLLKRRIGGVDHSVSTKRTQSNFHEYKWARMFDSAPEMSCHVLPNSNVLPGGIGELGIPVGEMGEEDVRRLMAEFYAKNPLARVPQSLVKSRLQEAVDNEWFRAKFLEAHREMMKTRSPDLILELVTKSALSISEDEDEFLTNVLRLLELATAFYLSLNEEDREKFPRAVMQYMTRSGRSGWRG